MFNVEGKWALVTGASRGIGYLAALYLADKGCNIIAHARKKENCEKVIEEIKKHGVKVYAVEAELSDVDEVNKMCKEIDNYGTKVDIILNNAGYQIAYHRDYLGTPAYDFDVSFRVNTTAPMMIAYRFLPGMKERGYGRIVNTTSGIDLEPEQAAYSASKAALSKITRDLGRDFEGTDVMISLTDPGWCRTDLGGKNAPNEPESAIPGVVVGVFIDDKKSGRLFAAQDYTGLSLEEAVKKAQKVKGVY